MFSQLQNKLPKGRYWPEGDIHSAVFQARYPDPQRLTEEARHASQGEIVFWHPWHMEKTWVHQKLESPIDWGKVRTGDEEWPHALVRLSHLIDLAAGWKLTGERSLLDCYWDHVTQFCHARRETRCQLWPNRLDSALRIFHFIKSFDLLHRTNDSTEQQRQLLMGQIQFEVDFLLGGLGSKVGNWELIICCALLTGAEYLNGVVEIHGWRDKASARLQELLTTEIQSDGHWIEQAPMYHGECIIALADYVTILMTNDLPVPDWLVKAMQTLLVTLEEITDPQGKIPQIGDSDAFETAYISHLCEVLLGELARGDRGNEAEPPLVKVYQPTGWAVSKWNEPNTGKKYQLLFDASGKPPKRRQWHSHADDLQVILTSSDGPILIDPGRFTYSSALGPDNPTIRRMIQSSGLMRRLYGLLAPQHRSVSQTDWRNYFVRTLAHNTIGHNCQDLSGYGIFESDEPTVRLVQNESDEKAGTFLMRGSIEPDSRSPHGYRQSRTVVGALPHLVVIIDDLSATTPSDWTIAWHLGSPLKQLSDTRLEFGFDEKPSFGISIRSNVDQMRTTIDDDWLSREYNQTEKSKTVRATINSLAHARILTAVRLAPLGTKFENENLLIRCSGDAGLPYDRIKLDSGDRSLIIWHQDEPKTFTDGEFTIDKELFVHRSWKQ